MLKGLEYETVLVRMVMAFAVVTVTVLFVRLTMIC